MPLDTGVCATTDVFHLRVRFNAGEVAQLRSCVGETGRSQPTRPTARINGTLPVIGKTHSSSFFVVDTLRVAIFLRQHASVACTRTLNEDSDSCMRRFLIVFLSPSTHSMTAQLQRHNWKSALVLFQDCTDDEFTQHWCWKNCHSQTEADNHKLTSRVCRILNMFMSNLSRFITMLLFPIGLSLPRICQSTHKIKSQVSKYQFHPLQVSNSHNHFRPLQSQNC